MLGYIYNNTIQMTLYVNKKMVKKSSEFRWLFLLIMTRFNLNHLPGLNKKTNGEHFHPKVKGVTLGWGNLDGAFH